MKNRSRVVALSIGIVAVAACSIPARDNPNDPSNRPNATLTIAGPDGAAEGSVHDSFLFSVTSSSDAITSAYLDLDGSGAFAKALVNGTARAEIPVASDAFGDKGVGTLIETIRARVSSAKGTTDISADVHIQNSAPIVDLGADVVAAAWEQPIVHLDPCADQAGCSADPDGPEGLTYTWTQSFGVPVIQGAVHTSSLTFIAPSAPQSLVFQVTVDDGFTKRTESQSVRIGRPAWAISTVPTRLNRVVPDLHVVDIPSVRAPISVSAAADGDVWMISGDYNVDDWEADQVGPDGTVKGRWTLPGSNNFGGAEGIVGLGTAGGWAVVGVYGNPYHGELRHFAPLASGTAGFADSVVSVPFGVDSLVADPDVPGGAIVIGSSQGVHVRPDLTVTAPFSLSSQLQRLVTVANDGTLWSVSPDQSGHLQLFHLLPGDVTETKPLLEGVPETIVRGSEGVLLVYDDGLSLTHVQPVFNTTDPLPPELPMPAVPEGAYGTEVVSDGDGDLYLMSLAEEVVRRLHGTENDFESAMSVSFDELGLPAFDGNGGQPFPELTPDLWNGGVLVTGGLQAGHALLARIPASGQPFQQAFGPLPYYVSTEPGRGSYWTMVTLQSLRMRRYDTNGTVLADYPIPSGDSAGSAIFGSTPDGGAYYAAQTQPGDAVMRRISRAGQLVGTPVDIAYVANPNIVGFGLDGTGAPACVAMLNSNMAGQVSRGHLIRVEGGTQTEFATGQTFGGLAGVAATRNGACWGWMPLSSTIVFYDGSGGAVSIALADEIQVATADPYDDSAWVAIGNPSNPTPTTTIVHMQAVTGAVLGQFAAPAILRSTMPGWFQLPITRGCAPADVVDESHCRELWLSDGSSPSTIHRVDGTGATLGTLTLPAGSLGYLDVR